VEALAAWGASGILEGRDYRGVRVIAFAEKLEGTPWVLLAKADRAEALAGWRSDEAAALLIIALVELTIVGGSVGLWSRWVAARRRDDAQRLATVLETLRSRPGSTHDLLVRLLRAVMDRTGSPAGAVYRYDAERDRMRPEVRLSDSIVQPGPPDARSFDWVPTAEIGAWAEPLTTGKPLIVNKDADRVLEARGHPRHHLALSTFLAVPVVVDGTPVAVAGLANRASGYDERDAVELALVFEAAWHEVERLRALEELEALNAELEQRVQERTEELETANEELQAQAEELAASNEEIAAANEELLAQTEQLNAANRELEAQAEQLEEQARELEQRAEELAEANEAKTRFLRTMSHELRTPLNSIIGFTELLLQGLAGPLNDEQHKQLSMVNASGHHLLTLVNDLLDLSRIEAGAVVFSRAPIDVAALVREATQTSLL
jgi:signal transduction histidine kinase